MGRSWERWKSEIKVSLERLQSMSGAYTARNVFTNTVDVVSENDAGCELTWQKQWPGVKPHHSFDWRAHSIPARGCRSRLVCRTARTKWVVWCRTERRRSVEIEQSTIWISQSSKIVAQAPRECPGKFELSPTPDGSKLIPKRWDEHKYFRSFRWRVNVWTEYCYETGWTLVKASFDEDHRKNGEDRWQKLFPGQSDWANGTRILGGSESEVHPKCDKCSWFGRSKPMMTPSVRRTPTTESIVELEGERRAMCRTVVRKLLYMCQERANVMYSVQETARKITCPTESDEMNLKRIVRYLQGTPSAKSLIEIITPSKFVNVYTDSDWAGQATTCKSTSGGVVQWWNATLTAWSRTQQTVSLSSAEEGLYALTTGVAEGMVTKHLLQELGHEVILMNHVCKSMGIQERTWKNETCDAEVHVCTRCCGEEVHKSCIHQHKAEQSRSDDKVSHIWSTQERLRDDRIETRLKQNKEVQMQCEKKSTSRDEEGMRTRRQVKKSDIKWRNVRSRQSVQTSRKSAENNTSFQSSFQQEFFDNVKWIHVWWQFWQIKFFENFDEFGWPWPHRASDHSDSDTVTTGRTDGADKGDPTV